MSEHTPGKLTLIGEQGTALWSGDSIVAKINEPRSKARLARANARRLVAAWNACDGIPTDDLEACPEGGLFHLADHANRLAIEIYSLHAVNAELLEALKTARDHLDMDALRISHCKDAEQIGAAIANANALKGTP